MACGHLVLWVIAQVRGHSAVGYSSVKESCDAVDYSLDKGSSFQYQALPHPHICTEVASENITYLIFPMRLCQNLGKIDSIVCVLLCMRMGACAFMNSISFPN